VIAREAARTWALPSLAWRLARRDIETRYRGSALGLLWAFVNPIALLVIYTYVFGVVFEARWPRSGGTSLGSFALTLFCGLIAFNVLSECLARAPTLLLTVPHYVKRIIFPIEILPVSLVGSALFHGLVNVLVLLAASLVITGHVPWTSALLPVVLLPLVLLALAVVWVLSSVGAFVRDLTQVVTLVSQALMFGSPIFYPEEALPSMLRRGMTFNPLAWLVENARRVLLWGELPDWGGLAAWTLATGLLSLLAYAWFMKTKRAIADVV
jgi:lipopolysaccharide transport system permease protein